MTGIKDTLFLQQFGDLFKTTASSYGISDQDYERLLSLYKSYNSSGEMSKTDTAWLNSMVKKYGNVPGWTPT